MGALLWLALSFDLSMLHFTLPTLWNKGSFEECFSISSSEGCQMSARNVAVLHPASQGIFTRDNAGLDFTFLAFYFILHAVS